MSPALRSVLIGTAGLDVAAVLALGLTWGRGGVRGGRDTVRTALLVGGAMWLAQGLHFTEELATGFHQRFPELLGLAPWSARFFVTFNLVWLVVWALSLWGLADRRQIALFPLWFLAIAGLANGVVHPLLSLRVAGYFPGLVTSPLVGLGGLFLLARLRAVTAGD